MTYEMKAQGFMERLIPYLDDYQLTIFKIQNFKNRAVPSGWWINLDALENVALNKGGKNMEPSEVLKMFFETGALVGRSLDAAGQPMFVNTQPIIPIGNSIMQELVGFYNDLLNTISQIEKLTGYNDVTMGDASAKTLVPGYQTAEVSTSHALYPLKFAQSEISKSLAADVLTRMQQGVKRGGIVGYAPALNSNTLILAEISPSIAWRDYGIELEERTTDDQKMWLLQQMQGDIANGFLDTSDAILIINTKNAKQAQQICGYRVKKAKQLIGQQKMSELQATNEANQQSAMMTIQAKQQEIDRDWMWKLKEKEMTIQGELQKELIRAQTEKEIRQMQYQIQYQIGAESNVTKERVQESTAQAKIVAQSISSEGSIQKQATQNEGQVLATVLDGQHALEKQKLQNQKPTSSKK